MKLSGLVPGSVVLICLFSLLLAIPAFSHGQEQVATAEGKAMEFTPEMVEQGRELFADNCAGCHHSESTSRKVGPGLKGLYQLEFTPATKHPVNDANIKGHITQGGRRMPAFDRFSSSELDALIAYLRTL